MKISNKIYFDFVQTDLKNFREFVSFDDIDRLSGNKIMSNVHITVLDNGTINLKADVHENILISSHRLYRPEEITNIIENTCHRLERAHLTEISNELEFLYMYKTELFKYGIVDEYSVTPRKYGIFDVDLFNWKESINKLKHRNVIDTFLGTDYSFYLIGRKTIKIEKLINNWQVVNILRRG